MKILFLADPASPHTLRWGNSLHANGIELIVFGFGNEKALGYSEGIECIVHPYPKSVNVLSEATIGKLAYLKVLAEVKKIIRVYQPDILHAHYATSYGLLAALSGFRNLIISPWGSDLLSFPQKSLMHKFLMRFVLRRARLLLPSSTLLRKMISEISGRNDAEVLPFGIDDQKFQPIKTSQNFNSGRVVIGTIKALEHNYGIDLLIESIALLRHQLPNLQIELKIAGRGSAEAELKNLVTLRNLHSSVEFLGYIENSKIPGLLRSFDIVVIPSRRESFGVAILEAYAAGVPVIASDIIGFDDVCRDDETVLRFKSNDVDDLTNKLVRLINDEKLRSTLVNNALKFVSENFSLELLTVRLIKYYQNLLNER